MPFGYKTMEAISIPNGSTADAMAHIEAGQFDDALAILRSLIQRMPSDGQVHALVGICHAQQGNLDAAVKSLETAAVLSPRDPAVEYNLACALFQVGRLDQARWRLGRILEAEPDHEDAKSLLSYMQRSSAAAAAAPAQGAAAISAHTTAPRSAAVRQPGRSSVPEAYGAPTVGRRFLRGIGWGFVYSLWWTALSLIGAVLLSLFATRVAHAIIAFAVLAVLTTLFHSAMGVLTGLLVAAFDADEDTGSWLGLGVGFVILVIGVPLGFLSFGAVVFYLCTGKLIGRAVGARVQCPVTLR